MLKCQAYLLWRTMNIYTYMYIDPLKKQIQLRIPFSAFNQSPWVEDVALTGECFLFSPLVALLSGYLVTAFGCSTGV